MLRMYVSRASTSASGMLTSSRTTSFAWFMPERTMTKRCQSIVCGNGKASFCEASPT